MPLPFDLDCLVAGLSEIEINVWTAPITPDAFG